MSGYPIIKKYKILYNNNLNYRRLKKMLHILMKMYSIKATKPGVSM